MLDVFKAEVSRSYSDAASSVRPMPAGQCATISAYRVLSVHLAETRRNEPKPDRAFTDESDTYFIAERVAVRNGPPADRARQSHLAIPDAFTYTLSQFGWLPFDASPSNFADTLERGFDVR